MRRRLPGHRRIGDSERHRGRTAEQGGVRGPFLRFGGATRTRCTTSSRRGLPPTSTRFSWPPASRTHQGAEPSARRDCANVRGGRARLRRVLGQERPCARPAAPDPDAAVLVGDLGVVIRMPRSGRQIRWRHRRTLRLSLIGGGVGAGLVALPVVVTFPGEIVSWLPVQWRARRRSPPLAPRPWPWSRPLRWRTMAGPAVHRSQPPERTRRWPRRNAAARLTTAGRPGGGPRSTSSVPSHGRRCNPEGA